MNTEEIKNIIKHLIEIREEVFSDAINYSMNNELKHIDELFEVGETYKFELGYLDNSNDANLQLLVDLIKNIESTGNSLANLNKIDIGEIEE